MNAFASFLAGAGLAIVAGLAQAEGTSRSGSVLPEGAAVQEREAQRQAPDNTGRNIEHDRRLEAEDQSNANPEVELVTAIRQALTDQAELSVNARNIKIIVDANRVLLRGPVASEVEKARVEEIVRGAAGDRPVVNELEALRR